MPRQKVERKNIELLEVSRLVLDDQNFRLPEDAHGVGQKELLKILDRHFDPLTIGESLVNNGYFAEEPLVVIPKSPRNKDYIVVEGNRRLAALKLLLEEDLRPLAEDPDAWESLAKRLKKNLSTVPVVIYKNRDELATILGYRHIAGVLKWTPLSKARFINKLVEQKGDKADFAEIAREIGSRSDAIRKQYVAYRAYLQAKDVFQLDTSELEKNYSVFFRAITGTRTIAHFIGLSKSESPQKLRRPVPSQKAGVLEDLVGYIHGTETLKPVIRESRELTQLGEVLASKPALANLKLRRNLDRAWELTSGEIRRLLDNLASASYYLDEALKDAHRHKGDPKIETMVNRCAQTMSQITTHFLKA